jgi:hypothetical protein
MGFLKQAHLGILNLMHGNGAKVTRQVGFHNLRLVLRVDGVKLLLDNYS